MGIQQMLAAYSAGGAASPVVTWNPSDVNSHLTPLSAAYGYSNCSANASGSSTWAGVRGTLAREASTANHYFETSSNTNFCFTGIMKGATALADGVFPGNDTTGYGFYEYNGSIYYNNAVFFASYGTALSSGGGNIGLLLKNGKLYFRNASSGSWFNSADPVAETGYAVSGLTGLYFPAGGIYQNLGGVNGRFAAPVFVNATLPSGTQPWGAP